MVAALARLRGPRHDGCAWAVRRRSGLCTRLGIGCAQARLGLGPGRTSRGAPEKGVDRNGSALESLRDQRTARRGRADPVDVARPRLPRAHPSAARRDRRCACRDRGCSPKTNHGTRRIDDQEDGRGLRSRHRGRRAQHQTPESGAGGRQTRIRRRAQTDGARSGRRSGRVPALDRGRRQHGRPRHPVRQRQGHHAAARAARRRRAARICKAHGVTTACTSSCCRP
jgi:hypothetical protein